MKFMEKAKRFFTLNAAKHEGFTLVELIVVIAILAILAGVAVPAYSGYIKKAEKAGDLQLLGAVNEAFQAACMVQNLDARDISSATLEWTGNCVTGIASASSSKTLDATKLDTDFLMFFAGNTTTEFKALVQKVAFVGGVFVDLTSTNNVTVNYAGSSVTVSSDALLALKGSTFGQNMEPSALLNQVNDVTTFASGMVDKLDAVFEDGDFVEVAMNALGVTTEEEFGDATQAIVDEIMVKNPGMTEDEAFAQMNTNAAVLYASRYAADYTEEQITALFAGGSDAIKDNLKTDGKTADGMAQAALVYGMYTAYANQPGNEALKDTVNDPIAVLNAMDDEGFQAFVTSDQGKQDMVAYQSALGVIVDSTENNPAATTDLMVNGFNNEELMGVIGGLMG